MHIYKLQSAYNLVNGIWPILHLKSFEAVTGKKKDGWLVKTIGWLFVLSGLYLWVLRGAKGSTPFGVGWATIIGGTEIYYGAIKRRIRFVYLLDAIVEGYFIARWIRNFFTNLRESRSNKLAGE